MRSGLLSKISSSAFSLISQAMKTGIPFSSMVLSRFDYSVDISPSASEIFFESFSSSSFDLAY